MSSSIPVVYIAGPYTAATRWDEEQNVRRAEAVGYRVAAVGAMPLIPHTNTRPLFASLHTPEWWYDATLAMLRRCDAVMLVPWWKRSVGARRERAVAIAFSIPVFEQVRDLVAWINERNDEVE